MVVLLMDRGMKLLKTLTVRFALGSVCAFTLAIVSALPFTIQQQRRLSPIAPLRPDLPDEPLAKREKLIRLPNFLSKQSNRDRRPTDSLSPLTEEQKILHLLNRAGFGPRPGDI